MGTLAPPLAFPLGANAPCNQPNTDAEFFDEDYFLALFERIWPQEYLATLKTPGPGYELVRAFADLGRRWSLAANRADAGAHILDSFGGTLANGLVRFTRPSAAAGAVTIKAGTVVTTSIGGRDYEVLADVPFGALDLGPKTVTVAAVAPSYQYNIPGEVITASGVVLPGEIDTIKLPVLDPPFGEIGFVVTQPLDICGGLPPCLDQLGADRGLPRRPGEADDAYRSRIRRLPDTVSPAAIIRALQSISAPLGVTFDFIETWQIDYQTCWDAPSPNLGTPTYQAVAPTNSLFNPNLFVYDDPRDPYPFRNRWLSLEDYRAAFIVVVPNLPAMADVGMAYDDAAMNAAGLLTTIGRRAVNAYDVPAGNFAAELQGGYDGFDLTKQSVYKGLFDLLTQIKAAGVTAAVELQGE